MTHVLSQAAEDGHCYLPQPQLMAEVAHLLKTESHEPAPNVIAQIIQKMTLTDELVRELGADKIVCCYKPTYFYTEQNLAQLVQAPARNFVCKITSRTTAVSNRIALKFVNILPAAEWRSRFEDVA